LYEREGINNNHWEVTEMILERGITIQITTILLKKDDKEHN